MKALGAVEEPCDGEELKTRVAAAVGGGVEARFGGFALHGLGGFGEGDVDANLGALALEDADQVTDFGDADVLSAFDREDDLFGIAGAVVVEVEAAVDAAISTFFDGFGGAGSAEAERPVLELVLVFGNKYAD